MNKSVLGDYSIIKQIGQGSLGTVFLAEHRFMKRHYVIKVLPEELASDRGFIQRFEEEVGELAQLDHPNIVKIHNISFSQGAYFLVTDCIVDQNGETTNLSQHMVTSENNLPEAEIHSILSQVASALDYSHSKLSAKGNGMIHRGLKLNNVLVGREGNEVKVYLSDFGLTRILGIGSVLNRTFKSLADTLGVTPLGSSDAQGVDRYAASPGDAERLDKLHQSFLQNFVFLAPEQKRLSSEHPVTAKADVYAFGVLAYYLLVGEFPEGIFDRPSLRRPEFKMPWDNLITACMQKNPEKRPERLSELLEDIAKAGYSTVSMPEPKAELPAPSQAEDSAGALHRPMASPAQAPSPFSATPSMGSLPNQAGPMLASSETFSSPQTPSGAPPFGAAALSQQGPQPFSQVATGMTTPHYDPNTAVASAPESTMAPVQETATAVAEAPTMTEEAEQALKPAIKGGKIERPTYEPDPAAALKIDPTVTQFQPKQEAAKETQPIPTDMVVLKGGQFWRGSDEGNRDESPRHKVGVKGFAIDIHPVTNEQFQRFLEAMGGEKDGNHHDVIRLRDSRIKRRAGVLAIESGYAKHPVVGVTWYGAVGYAKWLGKRLPTEAEWEIACLGGLTNTPYPTGENIEKSNANFFSSDTTMVMSYEPNAYGLYDMVGNVYEWCKDWYGYNYYESSAQDPDNPTGPIQGVYRVLRGGCWKSLKEDLRCSHRHRNNPGTVNSTYGFRCASDVE